MPTTREQLMARLGALGLPVRTVEHAAVFTVAESEQLHREIPGAHTKNLFLKDKNGTLYLVVADVHTKVDLKGLPKVIGSGRLSFGSAELLMQVLGVAPGSVTAFAVVNDTERRVAVIIDAALLDSETINCHPLENTATTAIAREDLLRFIRACGHEPYIVRLDGSAESTD